MLDELRNQTSFEPGDEDENPFIEDKKKKKPKKPVVKEKKPHRSLDQITGMKAPQRFVLALLLLMAVCLLGSILLIITGRVVLPLAF